MAKMGNIHFCHSRAMYLYRNGMPLLLVAARSGHSFGCPVRIKNEISTI